MAQLLLMLLLLLQPSVAQGLQVLRAREVVVVGRDAASCSRKTQHTNKQARRTVRWVTYTRILLQQCLHRPSQSISQSVNQSVS